MLLIALNQVTLMRSSSAPIKNYNIDELQRMYSHYSIDDTVINKNAHISQVLIVVILFPPEHIRDRMKI